MKTPKVGFVSLGCPKALVDTEKIITLLKRDGYQTSSSYGDADIVIVNTCGFIDAARQESLEAIAEAIELNGKVIVTGCLGARREDILKVHPKVLSVTGPHQYESVLDSIREHAPLPDKYDPRLEIIPEHGLKLTPAHYAYIKIAEGCDRKCTFCIIPSMRGSLRSRTISDIMTEAESLVDNGVKELLIVSQDTGAYGNDMKRSRAGAGEYELENDLLSLCNRLGTLGAWIRLHYVYPYPSIDQIVPLMAAGHILPYLDIPLQHGSPSVLKRMKRPAATENTLERINMWREICPDIVIRSTFIVGFPGETEREFLELLDFVSAAELDRVGCFIYSPVEGASANNIAKQVDEEIKNHRWNTFMELQARISRKKLQNKVGRVLEVLIDGSENDQFVGRSQADAPEIDGNVYVSSAHQLAVGEVVKVKVTNSDDYDLWGEAVPD